ncbi:MAG: DoxX family protein [Melioribacteraceae bacterium]|nr:DoxX family protein [Melioribacteraceae bacterium]MCF8265768.1 DoxX family protein [Melioribacteraceae bacterium]MCF8412494.1 DoxX family protein [Melioribacteraceae bacterium]MCF8431693.1 DoxX family protein [Melioribacteraceae bacterium]
MLKQNFDDLARFILRVSLSTMMLTHGIPKLTKLLSGNFGFADPIGLGSTVSLFLAVGAEFFCSILVMIGYKVRMSSIPLIITMAVAAFIVHASDPWKKQEFALLYFFGFIVIALLDSGRFSLDSFLSRKK